MLLETDLKNPNLGINVKFYNAPEEQTFESEKQGRPIFKDVLYIRKIMPGDALNIVDRPAREEDKQEFPLHWARFRDSHTDPESIGTPLSSWPRLTPSQVAELKAMKFMNVEAIANASDASIQSVGMIAGASPFTLREAAQRFLKVAKDDSALKAMEDETKSLKEQIAEMRALIEGMTKPDEPKKGK